MTTKRFYKTYQNVPNMHFIEHSGCYLALHHRLSDLKHLLATVFAMDRVYLSNNL